jgi:cell division protein FtsZ
VPGLINVDFADVKTIMRDTGSALMGIGMGSGDNRASDAAKAAISSPLLELSIDGARGILFTITGGTGLGMHEVAEAAKIITGTADDNAKVIFGAVIDETMGEEIRITVIATGFEDRERRPTPSLELPEAVASGMTTRKSLYSSSLFNKKKASEPLPPSALPDTEELTKRPLFVNKNVVANNFSAPTATIPAPEQAVPPAPSSLPPKKIVSSNSEDEDLEIPAFIRKKMGI